jgi:hypothetical protein
MDLTDVLFGIAFISLEIGKVTNFSISSALLPRPLGNHPYSCVGNIRKSLNEYAYRNKFLLPAKEKFLKEQSMSFLTKRKYLYKFSHYLVELFN